jgi:hypothetical protein
MTTGHAGYEPTLLTEGCLKSNLDNFEWYGGQARVLLRSWASQFAQSSGGNSVEK